MSKVRFSKMKALVERGFIIVETGLHHAGVQLE
jgi:hypothetical protein